MHIGIPRKGDRPPRPELSTCAILLISDAYRWLVEMLNAGIHGAATAGIQDAKYGYLRYSAGVAKFYVERSRAALILWTVLPLAVPLVEENCNSQATLARAVYAHLTDVVNMPNVKFYNISRIWTASDELKEHNGVLCMSVDVLDFTSYMCSFTCTVKVFSSEKSMLADLGYRAISGVPLQGRALSAK